MPTVRCERRACPRRDCRSGSAVKHRAEFLPAPGLLVRIRNRQRGDQLLRVRVLRIAHAPGSRAPAPPSCPCRARRPSGTRMSTTARSWLMNRRRSRTRPGAPRTARAPRPAPRRPGADVGSSAMSSFGFRTSARARQARCRWPPESSCGNRSAKAAGSCTASSSSSDPRAGLRPGSAWCGRSAARRRSPRWSAAD